MNRRGFLTGILKAGIAAAILPPALTYARHWRTIGDGRIFVGVDIGGCGSITRCCFVHPSPLELETIFTMPVPYNAVLAKQMAMFENKMGDPVGPSFYDFVMGQKL